MELSPILVTVYNRLEHLKQSIDALRANELAEQTVLYIASDGPAVPEHSYAISQIRDYIKTIDGFKKIVPIMRPDNFGSHKNTIDAFNRVIKEHGRIIFVEDDTITSKNFLKYINEALDVYENDHRVLTVTGYMPPFKIPFYISGNNWLSKRHCNWGFGTWEKSGN